MGQISEIVFSPGGTTAEVAKIVSKEIGSEIRCIDLLCHPLDEDIDFIANDIVIVAMPVFAGRIPSVCPHMLKKLNGNGATAIAVVVYGNRDYEDALLELQNELVASGFDVIGAGAFIARHSIFPTVASGRPDSDDIQSIRQFTKACMKKIEEGTGEPLAVKGNHPYRDLSSPGLAPSSSSACTRCGICASLCPVGAIDKYDPRKTDKEKCIACAACIYQCPSKARTFSGIKYRLGRFAFQKKYGAPKLPETFV